MVSMPLKAAYSLESGLSFSSIDIACRACAVLVLHLTSSAVMSSAVLKSPAVTALLYSSNPVVTMCLPVMPFSTSALNSSNALSHPRLSISASAFSFASLSVITM